MRRTRKTRTIGTRTMTSRTAETMEGVMVMTGAEGGGAMKPDNGTTPTYFLTSETVRTVGVVKRGENHAVNATAMNKTTKRRNARVYFPF